jgi:predicted phage-related endonuclease
MKNIIKAILNYARSTKEPQLDAQNAEAIDRLHEIIRDIQDNKNNSDNLNELERAIEKIDTQIAFSTGNKAEAIISTCYLVKSTLLELKVEFLSNTIQELLRFDQEVAAVLKK